MDEHILLGIFVVILILLLVLIKNEKDEKFNYYDPKNNSPFNVAPKFWNYHKI